MRCGELMSSKVVSCFANAPVYKAAELMAQKDVGFVPILDGEKQLVGVVTDRDLTSSVLARRLDYETPLEQVMTRDVVTVKESEDLSEAEKKMAKHKLHRICVVNDGGDFVGVISLQDISQRAGGEEAGRVIRDVKEGELGPAIH